MSNYIIWNPKSRLVPTTIHPDRPTAIRIAAKMAAENQGEKFFVCKLVHSSLMPLPVKQSIQYVDLEKAALPLRGTSTHGPSERASLTIVD